MRKIFAVYDKKAESYGPLMALPHEAVAIREFENAVQQEDSPLRNYPDDFELHCIGSMPEYGVGETPIKACQPVVVLTASAVVAMRAPRGGEQLSLIKEA